MESGTFRVHDIDSGVFLYDVTNPGGSDGTALSVRIGDVGWSS